RLAGAFCNIRMEYAPGTDFEVGNDLLLFDDLGRIGPSRTQELSRNQEETNPRTGPPAEKCVMVKYWIRGGLVPVGAKGPDGTAHPHAGTGFGMLQAVAWPLQGDGEQSTPGLRSRRAYHGAATHHVLELQQYAYDGARFRVLETRRFGYGDLLQGWSLSNPAMRNAIADGDDLLLRLSGNEIPNGVQPEG